MFCGCTCFKVLSSLVEGVQRLSLKAGHGIKGVTAVVVFSTHHAASMAKKTLPEGKEPDPEKLQLPQQGMNIDLIVVQWTSQRFLYGAKLVGLQHSFWKN